MPNKTFLPIVDVVIPAYNYGHAIGRAIQSVKDQTITNFACYIVDDGSTDNTIEAVQKEISGDERFHLISQPNAGVANARNAGAFAGNGKYICCLDADDAIAPEFLSACVEALEKDRTISIAYTGLWYIKPDGEEGLSPWPGEFNYDEQLVGKNQIPTCCVARREVWERLGGQRQRYAPYGAGEEDAEFWLRAGAYGFRAKKVTDAGLFIYSWMTGRVSGNKQHKMTNYRSYHPWVEDEQHPFASIASVKNYSHPVRQYDEPVISVVIPVGPGHNNDIIEALDSLEAQKFRKWEAIVVWDNSESTEFIERTYPYIKLIKTDRVGAGAARNAGAKIARGAFLVFLDADDQLLPNALGYMYGATEAGQSVIFTDHLGKAELSVEDAQGLKERLIEYNDKTGIALFSHGWMSYECERATAQPNPQDMYHWCLVTCLVPKLWHDKIGGFDETMKSWEDWDYHIRLARAGKCYSRVATPLVVYRYYTGNRREDGLKDYKNLVKYMQDKFSKEKPMPCNCKDRQQVSQVSEMRNPNQQIQGAQSQVSDDEFAMSLYDSPNRGQHRVVGAKTGIFYGYRAGGDSFLVNKRDVEAQSNLFKPIKENKVEIEEAYAETPPPVNIVESRVEETVPQKPKRGRPKRA